MSTKLDGGLVPQADSLSKVRELVRAVAARRSVPIRDAGLAAGLSPRHAAYYGRAAETLGLIVGGDHAYEVSKLGQQLLATEPGSEGERAVFRDAFARSPLMAIDPQLLGARYEPSREKLSSRIETMSGLSASTAHRRAGTLLAWREFMLAQPQLAFTAPEGARAAAPAGTEYLDIRRLGPIGEARVEFGDLTVLVGPQATGKSLLLQMWKLAVDRGFVIPELRRLGSDLSTAELAVGAYLGAGMGGVWGSDTEIRGSRGELNRDNVRNLQGTQESTEIETSAITITDSLDFDAALKPSAGADPRYDYLLGLRGATDCIDAVEVHPATSGEVKRIVAKCTWSRAYLHTCAVGVRHWHWISTNRIGFRRGGQEERRLRAAGVRFPVKHLVLR